jgi:hypothetical protein
LIFNEESKEHPSFLRAGNLGASHLRVFRPACAQKRKKKALSTVLLRERAKNRKRAIQPPKNELLAAAATLR